MEAHNIATDSYQNTPLISVITLSYKSPDLHASIDSVLEQDYPYIQYILIDDGTPSFSKSEVEAYITKNLNPNIKDIQIIENTANLGTVRAANIGTKQARGEFVFFLAGDDVFHDSLVLSSWVEAFQTSKALVMTAYRDMYDQRLEQFLERLPTAKQVKMIKNMLPAVLFEEIATENFIFGCCTARSRACLNLYGDFDERYKLVEDHHMVLRLLRYGVPIVFFDRPVVKCRSNGTSSGAQFNQTYQHDDDLLLEIDALPFSSKPSRITKQHSRWKSQQLMYRELYQLQEELSLESINEGKALRLRIKLIRLRMKVFWYKLWYHFRHPYAAFHNLVTKPGKVKKLFRVD